MVDVNQYILEAIKTWVWSGFYSPADVDLMIGDILEAGADEAMLRAAVRPEFEKKAAAEAGWPENTDCDRLDRAFAELNAPGIIALQNAGLTMSDGRSDVSDVLQKRGRKGVRGYCFYHGQDLERAVHGEGLWLAFGAVNEDQARRAEVGRTVKEVMERHGFAVDWNGDPDTRINLPHIDWKRRFKG
jgi:hypothetical protein